MTKVLEMFDILVGHLKLEVQDAINRKDMKRALKVLRQLNKLLPEQYRSELLE